MRSVLDADTVPDTAKRSLLAMGRARGLNFDRLIQASMWDEESGIVTRTDGRWPSVEGFEADAAGAALTTADLMPWRDGDLAPELAGALTAVAAEVASIAEDAAAADAVRMGETAKPRTTTSLFDDGEEEEEEDGPGEEGEDAAVAALERRLRESRSAGTTEGDAEADEAASGAAKKGFGGFGGGPPRAKAAGRGFGKGGGSAGKRGAASPSSSSTTRSTLPMDAFLGTGPALSSAVDMLMGVAGEAEEAGKPASPFRPSFADHVSRSLASSAATLLGILVDPDMECMLEDAYSGGNFWETGGDGREVVVEAAASPLAGPTRAHLAPALADGFATAVREAARARAAAVDAAALPPPPRLPEGAASLAVERAEIEAAMAALGVGPAQAGRRVGPDAAAAAAGVAGLAAVAAAEVGGPPLQEPPGVDAPSPLPPPPRTNALERRKARRAGKTAAWLAAQAAGGEVEVAGAGGGGEVGAVAPAPAPAPAAPPLSPAPTQSRPAPIGDAVDVSMIVVEEAAAAATAPIPSTPPPPPARIATHAYASRDETGARPSSGRPREVRQVPWAHAIGYVTAVLRPPERAAWKAAGVLIYTFDPYGELMLLLGRTFMYTGDDGGPPAHAVAAVAAAEAAGRLSGDDDEDPDALADARARPVLRAWNLLGGKRKRRDATAEATAIRELVEETGGLVTPDMLRGPLTPVLWYPPGGYAAFPYCLPPGEAAYALPDRFAQRRAVGRASIPASGHDTACLDWVRLRSILSGRRRIHVFMEDMLRRTRLMDWLRTQQEQYWAASPRPLRVRGGAGTGTGRGGAAGVGGPAPFLPLPPPSGAAWRGEEGFEAPEAMEPPPLPTGVLHLGGGGGGGGGSGGRVAALAAARSPPPPTHPRQGRTPARPRLLHSPDAPAPIVLTPTSTMSATAWPSPEGTACPPRRPRGVHGDAVSAAVLAAAAGPLGSGAVFLPQRVPATSPLVMRYVTGRTVSPSAVSVALGSAAAAAFLPPLAVPPSRGGGGAAAAAAAPLPPLTPPLTPGPSPFAVINMPAASQAGEAAVVAAAEAMARLGSGRGVGGGPPTGRPRRTPRPGSGAWSPGGEGGPGRPPRQPRRAPAAGAPSTSSPSSTPPPRPKEGGDGSTWYGR